MSKLFEKSFHRKKEFSVAQKNELVCILPFIGKKSLQLRSRLVKSIQQNVKFCSLNVIYQSPCKLHTLFTFKDSLEKRVKNMKEPAVFDHHFQCDCVISFDELDVLVSDTNNFRLLIKEILWIKRDKAILNRTIMSFPLKLFD